MRIIAGAYRGRILNIHPALLPKYGGKGMYGERVHRAVIEAGNAPGSIVSRKCCELTRAKAKRSGMAITVARNSNHFGEAAYWSLLLAQKDMIGYVTTNSIVAVAAPNGVSRAIGSNPFSWSVPAGKYANICLDVAVGYMAQDFRISAPGPTLSGKRLAGARRRDDHRFGQILPARIYHDALRQPQGLRPGGRR